jgi:thiaminase/transcriptional activator TenA
MTGPERFSATLAARAQPAWSEAIDHPFTRELQDGTLDDAVYREYLLQDYAFLETLARVVGYAVAQAPDIDAQGTLAQFLAGVTGEENDYFERSFDALDVPASTWQDPEVTATTQAFTDSLLGVAGTGGYADVLAVFVPVEWIYLEWATRASDSAQTPDRWYLAEWIDLHANPEFETFVEWLRGQLDAVGEQLDDERRERVATRFERTVELEVAFFDAAYEQAGRHPEVTGRGHRD